MGTPGPKLALLSDPRRESIDNALASGEPVAEVSQRFSIPRSTLYRYVARTLAPAMRDSLTFANAPGPASLLQRLMDLADDMRSTRMELLHRGELGAHGSAAVAEAKVLELLAFRLGIDSSDQLDQLTQSEALGRAVGVVVRADPTTGQKLADELHKVGALDMEQALREELSKGATS